MLDLGALRDEIRLDFHFTEEQITPLMLACANGNKMVVDLVMKNPSIQKGAFDRAGYNCLYYATYNGHLEVLKLLKDHAVPYKMRNNSFTCLQVAVKKNFVDLVDFFLCKTDEHYIEAKLTKRYVSSELCEGGIKIAKRLHEHQLWES